MIDTDMIVENLCEAMGIVNETYGLDLALVPASDVVRVVHEFDGRLIELGKVRLTKADAGRDPRTLAEDLAPWLTEQAELNRVTMERYRLDQERRNRAYAELYG